MRKDGIKRLIAKYSNSQTKLLTLFLETACQFLNDDQDISFKSVLDYLRTHDGFIPSEVSHALIKDKKSDDNAFYFFVTGTHSPAYEQKEEKKAVTSQTTNNLIEILAHNTAKFLDPKSAAKLSACSSSFYRKTTNAASWQHKILALGCNEKILAEVIESKVIRNYKKLYRTLLHRQYGDRVEYTHSHLQPWELYCASGELHAIQYAIQLEELTQTTAGINERDALLHCAALGGLVASMEGAIEDALFAVTGIEDDKTCQNVMECIWSSGSKEAIRSGAKIFHLANASREKAREKVLKYVALSGSVAAIKYAIAMFNSMSEPYGISPYNRDQLVFDYTALSGSVEAIKYALETFEIKPHHYENVFCYVMTSESVDAMKYVMETLKIAPTQTDSSGKNGLHCAAISGSVAAMLYAIETLKISPTAVDGTDVNALHYAACSGSTEAVSYMRCLIHERNLTLNPLDRNGSDVFWHASYHSPNNLAAVKEALTMPIEQLLQQAKQQEESKKQAENARKALPSLQRLTM